MGLRQESFGQAVSKLPATEKRLQKRRAPRVGRPPQKLAGEVDERILDTARRVFLECGLGGASIDEIARLAHAGKPTIYARFASKEALFSAVVMRNSAEVLARFESHAATGATLEERLISVGTNLLKALLISDVIDFMRLSIAEARRFSRFSKRRADGARARSPSCHSGIE